MNPDLRISVVGSTIKISIRATFLKRAPSILRELADQIENSTVDQATLKVEKKGTDHGNSS